MAEDSLQTHYAAPDALPDAGNRLAAIASELDNPADAPTVADAAQRFDGLLHDSINGLLGNADGSEIWIGSWIRDLSAARRETLSGALQSLDGTAAQQALDDLRAKPSADPMDYYAVARRYPMNAVKTDALRAAAGQFASLDDDVDAAALSAIADGEQPATPARGAQEVPFAAAWFGWAGRTSWTATRSFPTTADGVTYVAGPAQVVAVSSDFTVNWRGPNGEVPPAGRGTSNPAGITRGAAFQPALFTPRNQPAAVVVVRQPSVHADGWAIRALRASDGKLLWTTEGNSDLGRLVFGSNPSVAGRYVYAVAGEPNDDLDRLSLVALELTTGRILWRCDLGSVSHPAIVQHRKTPTEMTAEQYRPWLNQSAPTVSGDVVLCAPDVGVMVSVDRFDGSLRWLHPYASIGLPAPDSHGWAVAAKAAIVAAGRHHRAGELIGLPNRWNNTPALSGTTVVVAPQDSASVMAFDVRDGRQIWEISQIALLNPGKLDEPVESTGVYSLLGIQGNNAILQGQSLIALSLIDGAVAARTEPFSDVTGPGMMRDDRILLPTRDRGVVEFASLDTPQPSPIAMINAGLKSDSLRKALQSDGVLDSFSLPK